MIADLSRQWTRALLDDKSSRSVNSKDLSCTESGDEFSPVRQRLSDLSSIWGTSVTPANLSKHRSLSCPLLRSQFSGLFLILSFSSSFHRTPQTRAFVPASVRRPLVSPTATGSGSSFRLSANAQLRLMTSRQTDALFIRGRELFCSLLDKCDLTVISVGGATGFSRRKIAKYDIYGMCAGCLVLGCSLRSVRNRLK